LSATGAARPIEKGASPEETAAAAAASLASTIQSGACVDEYMQDQVRVNHVYNLVGGMCG